uniref:GNAT family N-acetyltransferase n=1 Tax=Halomonas sp. TaxID=1486246 RepID=UPI00261AD0EB|nr:GNAT family N-acetyltransferase [Halomonas sp.]
MPSLLLVPCDDLRAAQALVRGNMAEDYQRHGLSWDEDSFIQRWPRLEWRWLMLARRRCGLLAWEVLEARLYLRELQVMADERGRGLGSLALGRVEQEAMAQGCTAVRLKVLSGSRAAALYRRCGYQQVQMTPTPRGQTYGLEKALPLKI